MKSKKLFFVVILLLALSSWGRSQEPSEEEAGMNVFQTLQQIDNKQMEIKIVRVYDKNFPSISDAMYQKAVDAARTLLNKKFGFDFKFTELGMQDIEDYFKLLPEEKRKVCQYEYWSLVDEVTGSMEKRKKQVDRFAEIYKKKYKVNDLKYIFPKSERESIKTYEDVMEHAFTHWVEMLNNYQKAQLNGVPFLDKTRSYKHIRLCWKELDAEMTKASKTRPGPFVITNVPVFTDPKIIHTMTGPASIGGTGLFTSTFPFGVKFDFLKPYIDEEDLSEAQYPFVFGIKIAHELGHRLFGVRDYLNKKYSTCLMYGGPRSYGKLKPEEFFKSMLAEEPCKSEIRAVERVVKIFQAEDLTTKKKYEDAYALLAEAEKISSVQDYDSPVLLLKIWNAIKLFKVDDAKKAAGDLIELSMDDCNGYCSYASHTVYLKMQKDLTSGEQDFLKQLGVP